MSYDREKRRERRRRNFVAKELRERQEFRQKIIEDKRDKLKAKEISKELTA